MDTTAPPRPATVDVGDLSELLPDWRRHLRATNRAASTVRRYEKDARTFLAFLTEQGMPTRADSITREHLEHFLADEQSRPRRRSRGEAVTLAPATVAGTYRSLQQLWRWLVDEGEVTTNPFDRMKPPHVPEQPVAILSDEQLSALLAACKGSEFTERRDTALIRLLVDTGIRSSELLGLTVTDLDFEQDVALVLGKGSRARCRSLRQPHRGSAAPLPAAAGPAPPCPRGRAVVGHPWAPRAGRATAGPQPPGGHCRHRAHPPPPVPAHHGASLANEQSCIGRIIRQDP